MIKKNFFTATLLCILASTYGQKQIPGAMHVDDYNDKWAKEYFDIIKIDKIEGFWQSDDGIKYAIKKFIYEDSTSETNTANESFRMYISDPNSSDGFWMPGDIRAIIQKTSKPNVYSIEYTTFSFPNYFLEFDFGSLENSSLLTIKHKDGKQTILVKIYPTSQK